TSCARLSRTIWSNSADELRDKAEFDQIVRLHLAQEVLFLLGGCVAQFAAKTQGGGVSAALDGFVQAVESAAADEQDVLGVDLDELLLGMLAPALRRHVA